MMWCSELDPPQFGTVQLEGRNVNGTAKFMCNSGYDLVGAETLTCKVINNDASWSHEPPTCKRKGLIFSITKILNSFFMQLKDASAHVRLLMEK